MKKKREKREKMKRRKREKRWDCGLDLSSRDGSGSG